MDIYRVPTSRYLGVLYGWKTEDNNIHDKRDS